MIVRTSRYKSTWPTVVSFVTDALIFGVKHSFLQHAEDDDGTDPELDPQQIPPIAGTPEEPESPEQHVHNAHDHEELRWSGERERERERKREGEREKNEKVQLWLK